nr:MAG TPA: hypothetical protein [Caudoviricetes sp.]
MHSTCIYFSIDYSTGNGEESSGGLFFFRGKSERKRYAVYWLLYSVMSPHAR